MSKGQDLIVKGVATEDNIPSGAQAPSGHSFRVADDIQFGILLFLDEARKLDWHAGK